MLPVETLEALFPSSASVGKLTVGPMTAGHIAMLDTLDVDFGKPLTNEKTILAAWVLSLKGDEVRSLMGDPERLTDAFKAWCGKHDPEADKLIEAVSKTVIAAYSTFVPPKGEDGCETLYETPRGYGSPLELCEAFCSEYGLSFDAAMDMPISRMNAMVACARKRNGVESGGPDYYERIAMAKAAAEVRRKREEYAAKMNTGKEADGDGGK